MNLPNKLTMARVVCVPIFVALFMTSHMIAALVVFIIASITDMLDGKIARKYNLVTNFGKIMDPLADKLLVYSAFTLFTEIGVVPGWMFIIILAREFTVAGMRTVAASQGTVIAAGMSGKIKTVCQMICVCALLLGYALPIFHTIGIIFMWAALVMTVYSGTEYVYQNRKVFSM